MYVYLFFLAGISPFSVYVEQQQQIRLLPSSSTMAPDTEDDDGGLKKLEYLSLVSKVCSELESNIACADKTLAEFITDTGHRCESVDEFDRKIKEAGTELPDYFVRTLLTIIHDILPPKTKPHKGSKSEASQGGKNSKFPGLSISDDRDRIKQLNTEIEADTRGRKLDDDDDDDDDNVEEGRARDRDRIDRRDHRDRRSRNEAYRDRGDEGRRDHRGRGDRSDGKGGHRRDDEYRENVDRREGDCGSRGRQRDRSDGYRRDDYDEENGDRRKPDNDESREVRRGKQNGGHQSDEPELYQVYKGRVARVMEAGCFVQLSDLRGKEGLVHVSQMGKEGLLQDVQ